MGKLTGKTAIITGAAQGMGAEHVRLFVAEGAQVLLTDLLEEKGQALAQELGEQASFLKHDVSSADDWDRVAQKASETFDHVDILVNNAGITFSKPMLEITEQEYRRIVDINQISVFLGMKAIIPLMQKKNSGSIVNISSINGLVAGKVGYTDTKFAVRGMSKAAALEFSSQGIRVNSVHPGAIATPMLNQADVKDGMAPLLQAIPMKRVAQPEEVSKLVLFLASEDASYITGSEFAIDGGFTAW